MTLRDQVLLASRQADQEMPSRLQTNRNVDCFNHTTRVLQMLTGQGLQAAYVGKTAGEGQYHPPTGFPRQVGPWTITGVSHDAIWVEGHQFDLIGGGNDGPEPLGTIGVPTANEIPAEFHRPNNPPVAYPITGAGTLPPSSHILPKGEAFVFLKALDAFYRAPEGLQRPDGIGGDMEAIAQWFYQGVIEGKTIEDVKNQIRNSDEWKAKHP